MFTLGHSLAINARISLTKPCRKINITGLNFQDDNNRFTIAAGSFNGIMHHEYPPGAAAPFDNAVNNIGFSHTIA